MKSWFVFTLLPVLGLAAVPVSGAAPAAPDSAAYSREAPFHRRALELDTPSGWIGNGIAFGPHRDGQSPTGAQPTRDEIRQDLHLMATHWRLIRIYGSTGPARDILEVIRDDGLDTKVMLGVWIDPETHRDSTGAVLETFPAAAQANRSEIEAGVALASEFPDQVIAIGVGNETQVFWSSHRVAPARLIEAIREVRARTTVPVTTVDDYNFWNKPESDAMAAEVDFIAVNAHPLWNGLQLDDAVDWTGKTVAAVRAGHPGVPVILAETGWATERDTVGEQATLMKGAVGEDEQARFFKAVTAWAAAERIPTFFFEAFDENWKGGDRPAEVEKHWGLYRADRTPKEAMAGGK